MFLILSVCFPFRHRHGTGRGWRRPFSTTRLTRGELLTLSKPHPYPKSENTPAPKRFSKPNLGNSLGRFDTLFCCLLFATGLEPAEGGAEFTHVHVYR